MGTGSASVCRLGGEEAQQKYFGEGKEKARCNLAPSSLPWAQCEQVQGTVSYLHLSKGSVSLIIACCFFYFHS